MTTRDADEEMRALRDEVVRAQATAAIARRRVDELEAAVAAGADAVAERDLLRARVTDVEAMTARAENAERTLAAIYGSRVWRVARAYDRVAGRLRRP